MRLGWPEILLLVLLVLVLFGAKRLPELARSIGKSFTELRKGIKEATDGLKSDDDEKHKG